MIKRKWAVTVDGVVKSKHWTHRGAAGSKSDFAAGWLFASIVLGAHRDPLPAIEVVRL